MTSAASNPWFHTGPLPGTRLRIICLPYAGGGASIFRSWIEKAAPGMQVCGVELPGRDGRYKESLPGDVESIVQQLAPAVEPFLDCPYVLFGHSLGAFLAFELARELRRRGQPPPMRFFASACRAPHLPSRSEKIHQLADKQFLERLVRISGMAHFLEQSGEMLKLLLPILRADFRLAETYEFRSDTRFAFPITAIGGRQDTLVIPGDLVAWHLRTTGTFRLRMLAGGHLFLRSSPEQVFQTILEEL
jgi:surfactin synthase thioesterase subunit